MTLFHGGTDIVTQPIIRQQAAGRDFGIGFYCTDIREQAEKWAQRQGKIRKQAAILNIYEIDIDRMYDEIQYKSFSDYTLEWLEMVINCRKDPLYSHSFDLIYGKIANDDVGETIQAVIDGLMPLDFALQKLVFMPSNNQYCFCTEKSLAYLNFLESVKLE